MSKKQLELDLTGVFFIFILFIFIFFLYFYIVSFFLGCQTKVKSIIEEQGSEYNFHIETFIGQTLQLS